VTFGTEQWETSTSTAPSKPASISLGLDYPYYGMLFFRTYSEIISRKHSQRFVFLLVTNSKFRAHVRPLHLNHGAMLHKMV
jgi:hypothetical protein